MVRLGEFQRLHRLFGVVIATLGWLMLSPSNAQASCGDYVMIGGGHSTHETPTTTKSDDSLTPKSAPIHRDTPCRGPGCSKHQPTPAPTVPPPPPSNPSDHFIANLMDAFHSDDSAAFAIEPAQFALSHFTLRIEHPPR